MASPFHSILQRSRVVAFLILSGMGIGFSSRPADAAETNSPTLIVVTGAPGEENYKDRFAQWSQRWLSAGQKAGMRCVSIGMDPGAPTNSLQRLQETLRDEPKEGWAELWLVLIGHGTFDGREAKFNLSGSDFSSTELAEWLKPFQRRLAIIDCSSSSAPFLKALSAPNRTIVVATRSGSEQNATRFGDYISKAIQDPEADLDKDGQTSLLEAYLIATRKTSESYTVESRLVTEHALLDDNGDGFGTPADWFQGIRAVKRAKDGAEPDGLRAQQLCIAPSELEKSLPTAVRQRRDELELQVARLRDEKPTMEETAYYQKLEPLLIELAKLYQSSKQSPKP